MARSRQPLNLYLHPPLARNVEQIAINTESQPGSFAIVITQ